MINNWKWFCLIWIGCFIFAFSGVGVILFIWPVHLLESSILSGQELLAYPQFWFSTFWVFIWGAIGIFLMLTTEVVTDSSIESDINVCNESVNKEKS
jgi:hypothetical protein